MFDKNTLTLLQVLINKCKYIKFYKEYRDLCLAARLALLDIRGGGVKLRPSLLRLEELSDIKTASHLLRKLEREVGSVTDGMSLRNAAVVYIYKKLARLI